VSSPDAVMSRDSASLASQQHFMSCHAYVQCMTEHESHCTSEFAGSQQFATAIKYKNTCGEFMNGQMNEWMDMKQRGKQKNKQTNKQTNACLHTLAMSFVMIKHGHSIDSIIVLRCLRRHPRNTIHDLCKPLHHLVECHQLALLQDRIYFTFPNTHNCLVLMALTRVLATLEPWHICTA